MKMRWLLALLAATFLGGAAAAPDGVTVQIGAEEGITKSASGRGIPNGSSADKGYLPWLKPTEDPAYGYTKERPVLIGGMLEKSGGRWSAQYFSSLLGPSGQPTQFERVKSCCAFPLDDPKLAAEGFKAGALDVYRVTVEGMPPVLIYVSIYSEGKIYAPAGFTTRGAAL